MDDPERLDRPRMPATAGETAHGDRPLHPWVGLIERYVCPPRPSTADRVELLVLRWRTSRGEQPVILAIRHRRD